jgi:transcriptional regulator GlxA family with amidase domain
LIAAVGVRFLSFDRLSRAHTLHVKVARDFIHANANRRIEITELCRAIGISRRQLEYSFRASLGVGPRDYMSKVQLNEIRRALKTARGTDASVTTIALDHGVRHLSRFSQSYHRLFDEFPSETLGKRIERAGPTLNCAAENKMS